MHTPARLCRAAQEGRLPLHVAARHQASEAVVAALLAAHPGAAQEKDKVRPPRLHPSALRSTACVHTPTYLLASATQYERLPLHDAAEFHASDPVVAALLAAHPGAAKERGTVRSPLLHTLPLAII